MKKPRMKFLAVATLLLGTLFVAASHRQTSATFFPWPTNPDTIRGLQLWLDASDIDGDGNYSNNPADRTAIREWKDKSGNAHDAKVISGQSEGTYIGDAQAGINGQPTVRFDRINDAKGTVFRVRDVDIRAISQPNITIFSVYRPRNVAANNGVWGADNGSWDRFFLSYHPAFGDGKNDGIASLGPSQRGATVNQSGVSDVVRLLTVVYDGNVVGDRNQGPENGSAVYFNGKLIRRFTDSTHPSNAQSSFAIGWDGDNSVFDGDIAEVLIYGRVLSDEEIRDVNHYFSEKYSFKVQSPETVPGKPTSLSAICDESSMTVTFVAGAAGGDSINNYESSLDGGRTWTAFSPAVTASPIVVSGLTSGVENEVVIRAVNNVGRGEASEAVTCGHNVPPSTSNGQVRVPDAPTNIEVTESGEMIKIIFDEGDDGGSPITNYEFSFDDDDFRTFSPAETSSPVTFHNLDPDSDHEIRLRAVNAVGAGASSPVVKVKAQSGSRGDVQQLDALPATGSSAHLAIATWLMITAGSVLLALSGRRRRSLS